jgi:hypothetical protein
MDSMRFTVTDEDDEPTGATCSFRERLNRMIADGVKFPCFFASTEY